MTTKAITVGLVLALSITEATFAQQKSTQSVDTAKKMPVAERMVKARAAKAQKKSAELTFMPGITANSGRAASLKAIPADYKAPVDKTQKGPNGEVVRMGDRGGKYYINKNGNKTYLSSNQ